MATPSKLDMTLNALKAANIGVVSSTKATRVADAGIDLGNGVHVQITRRGLMYTTLTDADGKMSFDLQGTYSHDDLITKIRAIQAK